MARAVAFREHLQTLEDIALPCLMQDMQQGSLPSRFQFEPTFGLKFESNTSPYFTVVIPFD
jgi:hypothetical protein